jgi:replication factor C subunit 2/4
MSDPTVTKKPKTGYAMPWVEKYRPLTLDQVVGNEDTITRLQAIAEDGNMPNLILSGPPGTGKVSMHMLGVVGCYL